MAAVKINGLRSKARVLSPESFDPGQVVGHGDYRGVVWSLGPDVGRNSDSRWVVCEDGIVRVLRLAKVDGQLHAIGWSGDSWGQFIPSQYVPLSVGAFADVEPEQLALAA